MHRYFSLKNFRQALLPGAVMTLLSAPRIFVTGLLPAHYILPTFILLILLMATVTAWGDCAGMKGAFPQTRVIFKGVSHAIFLLVLFLPLKIFWFNPLFYSALEETGNIQALRLVFPESLLSAAALTLWVISFEILFFQGAAMSFFAWLTHRLWAALLLSSLLRLYVTWLRLAEAGIKSDAPLILSHAVLINLISCLLFMRYGLPAPMLFIGGLSLCRWLFLWS